MIFKSKQDCRDFVKRNIPFAISPSRKAKTKLISPFTSHYAMNKVIDHLTDKLWDKQHKS